MKDMATKIAELKFEAPLACFEEEDSTTMATTTTTTVKNDNLLLQTNSSP